MVYGSYESTPYEHEGRGEPDEVRQERHDDAEQLVLRLALHTGWFFPEALEEMHVITMRLIAGALAAYYLERKGTMWPAPCEALRLAWNDFCCLDSEALRVDNEESNRVLR